MILSPYLRRTWFESTLHSLPLQIFTCALNSASFRTGAGKRLQFLNCFLLYIQVTPSLNSNELEVSSILCTTINYTLFSGMLCWPFLYSFLASNLRKPRKTVSETCYVLKIMFLLLAVQIHIEPFQKHNKNRFFELFQWSSCFIQKTYESKLKRNYLLFVSSIFSIVLILGCSTQKNTAGTRAYHDLTTRYNILFNAQQSYDETLQALYNKSIDNYT